MVRVVVVVVMGVVVVVVVDVMVVLVVTFDQPHFQQLPYIFSYTITLKLNLIMTFLCGPCSCDHSIGCQAVVAKRNKNFFVFEGGGGGGVGEGFHVRFISGSPAKGKRKYGLISNYVGGDIRSGTLQYKRLQ